jgi:hypothetical protein
MKMKYVKRFYALLICLMAGIMIMTCDDPDTGLHDDPEQNQSDGSGENGGNGSGERLCNWSAECLAITVKKSSFCSDGLEWVVTNICNTPLKINFKYQIRNGTWVALAASDVKPGEAMKGTYSCSATGNYIAYAMPYADWLANRCSTPDIDGAVNTGNGGGESGGSGGSGNNMRGSISFWLSQDKGCGNVTVMLEGVGSKTLSKYFTSGTPTCGSEGTVTFSNLPYGKYTFKASCSKYSWSNTITLAESCHTIHLQ